MFMRKDIQVKKERIFKAYGSRITVSEGTIRGKDSKAG